ncbi:polynucleotide 3'-phosphatase ZDP [Cynara cardunculus var. scolymus]|uniref:polynucleotide 3'-phosphatase ZDP n=1 Tax=Cynara cardunculus var. scolymus TaxID=59895 RepID=UPI000D62D474|nr:polynucleotide 3'-phosphatase ZDP [Cynara cardunculus var. scolymus]
MFLVFNPRISFFSRNPRFVVFDLYAMSSSSSSKIVAEYAKSGKSSCKKCSQKIDSKALRLGLKIRDPRGYDSTKWHHLDCFFSLDSVPVSYTETIEGFSELTGSDQDKLKQMVSEGDQSSTKREGDVELESQRTSSKKLKMDEDEEAGQAKKNVTDEKIVAEYAKSGRSSCKKCAEKIDSKSLRLGFSSWDPRGFENTKWHHLDCFFPLDTNLLSAESIEGFSELKSSDQEKLKKLVTEGDQSSKESNEDGETELEGRDQKSGKTDEDEEAGKEKENVKNEKIVAEYAKSGRSLCKKCAEKIDSKSLRLGLTSWDPRGFENTKWHHIDCFFPLDSNLLSAESIEGFSELKSSDQEKLKKLVTEGDQSSKKSNEDGETELAAQDQTSEKISNSLDARVGSEIDFAVSDIKDNYKGATLQPKWKAFRTIVYLERDDGLQDSRKIAAFDFDGCLAKTSVQRVGATAWSLMYASIPKKLQSLYNDGYKLVIFTNESNIERWKNKRQVAVDSKIGRLNSLIKLVNVPIQVFIACGISKGKEEDPFRKPQPGMWRIMEQEFNSGIPIDMDQSFYVGDAAGRIDDHSDADKKFAEAIGLKFYLPEEYFDA